MSVTAILGSLFGGSSSAPVQNKFQQIKQDFQQLGQDLQSGNLSQAQSDFTALQQLLPSQQQNTAPTSQTASRSTNPISQAISQLGQDLQSGNLTAAKSDFSTLQQDVQQQQATGGGAGHHHHFHVDNSQAFSQQSGVASLFASLGQSLQSGNITAAQQTYSALQQDFLQFSSGAISASGSGSSNSANSSFSVSV
jgi:outer membrane protein assembly factor BamD (BamD/ComL family)